jgi:hypothetical protein
VTRAPKRRGRLLLAVVAVATVGACRPVNEGPKESGIRVATMLGDGASAADTGRDFDSSMGPPVPDGSTSWGPLPACDPVQVRTRPGTPFRTKHPYREVVVPVEIVSPDTTFAAGANRLLRDMLDGRRSAFEKSAAEMIETYKESGDPHPDQIGLEIHCKEIDATARTLSVVCIEVVALGGPYPNWRHVAVNMTACRDSPVTMLGLKDICEPADKCRERLVAQMNRELGERDADIQLPPHASAPETFAITPTGLRFFGEDDVAHAVASEATVDVPYANLRAALGPEVELWEGLPR